MILIGLSILAAFGLLVLIVWALHRNQRRKNEESVDRNLPLPPLELNETEAGQMSALEEEMLGIAPAASSPARPTAFPPPAKPAATAETFDQWLPASRELLANGEFDKALQQCHSALPQMGAFRQSCVILRAQIRELKKTRRPYLAALSQLYQLAALADFFHGKAPGTETLPPSVIKKIEFHDWHALSSPYATLGYVNLSLLTKTDAKWLVQEWGEPNSHGFMRVLHQTQWSDLQRSLS